MAQFGGDALFTYLAIALADYPIHGRLSALEPRAAISVPDAEVLTVSD